MRLSIKKLTASLLALVLLVALLPTAAFAVSIEDSSFVSDVRFGTPYLTMSYDAEGDQYLVPFPDTVAPTAAKGLVCYATGPDQNMKYKIQNLNTGKYLASTGTLNGKQYIGVKTLLVASNITPTSPLTLQLEAGEMSGTSFTGDTEKIKFHFFRDLKLQSLAVLNGESELTLTPAFDSLTYSYSLPLEEGQETVTLSAVPQTALTTAETAGTLLLYTDQDGNEVEPLEGTESTFSVPSLPQTDDGIRYIIITVDYSDSTAEVGKSTYAVFFVNPEDCMPVFSVEEGPTIFRTKGSREPIQIQAEGEYSYQWYETNTPGRLEKYIGTPIEGATGNNFTPDTNYATSHYLWCDVTNTVAGVPCTLHSQGMTVVVSLDWVSPPVITVQPQSIEAQQGTEGNLFVISYEALDKGVTVSDKWYRGTKADGSDAVYVGTSRPKNDDRKTRLFEADTGTVGIFYYFCLVTAEADGYPSADTRSDIITLTVRGNPYAETLSGAGTEEDPWLIQSSDDFVAIKSMVEDGFGTGGKYFLLTTDLELPQNWTPIGNLKDGLEDIPENTGKGSNVNVFSGNFNGGNHTITIPDGKEGLFKYVRRATISNLQVYGVNIDGNAIITTIFLDYGPNGEYNRMLDVWTANIDHVILKSGSHTSRSGFVDGTGSGMNTITITNSTVENNVTIGEPGEGYNGSFEGSFNGVLQDCVSYATVYGNGAGGLVAMKGQTMGACIIKNCSFYGEVISTSFAGGIIGTGYGYGEYSTGTNSAPQTPPVTIMNCIVAGNVTGKSMVGGILGGEPDLKQATNVAYISDNLFYGEVHATDDESYVGGIIGYLGGYDSNQKYQNNFWLKDCGAERGIGHINYIVTEDDPQYGDKYPILEEVDDAYIDRICTAATVEAFADGTVTAALNTSESSLKNWVQGEDYPIHGEGAYAEKLLLTGRFKTDYVIGDELDMTGASFTVVYSDGAETPVALEEITFTGFDSATRGFQTVTAAFGPVSVEFEVCVLYPDNGQTIRVLLSIWGDTQHDSTATGQTVHTMADRNLELWAAPAVYEVGPNATVRELLEQVMASMGMSWENPSGNYIETVTYGSVTIGEFTNGPDSGWMYFYNGIVSLNGVAQQFLEDGDEIVFRYTDDYNREKGNSEMGGADNVSFRSVAAAGSTAAPAITFNAEGYSVTTVSIGSTAIALTDTAEDNAFVITSTGDVPAAVLVKDAEGNYSRRAVTTEEGVHKVVIAAGEAVVVGVLGDADGDGTLNARDTTLILRTLTYNGTAESSAMDDLARLIADADGNGTMNVRDVTRLLRFMTYAGAQPNSSLNW